MTLRLSVPEDDDQPSGLVSSALDDLPWGYVKRLQALMPHVEPTIAATALLMAAIEDAELTNAEDEA